jgi:hypothetical protein
VATVLGHRVFAPSTIGTSLRAFSFDHVRQLEAVVGKALERARLDWSSMSTRRSARSTVGSKPGSPTATTKVLGYLPILATPSRHRRDPYTPGCAKDADTQRGTKRFVEELIARVRRAGATGQIVARFDSGCWSNETIATLTRADMALYGPTTSFNSCWARAGPAHRERVVQDGDVRGNTKLGCGIVQRGGPCRCPGPNLIA